MSWAFIKEFLVQDYWQYSAPIEGYYFRITSFNPPSNARLTVAQAMFGTSQEIYDARKFTSPQQHLISFQAPPFWGDRRIALRRSSNCPAWRVALEVSDAVAPVPGDSPGSDSQNQHLQADNSVISGQPLYINNAGHLAPASASSMAFARVCGFALSDADATMPASYTPDGVLTLLDWTAATGATDLAPGALYFLSPVPGRITTTAPIDPGQVVVAVGLAISPTSLAIEIQLPFLL